MNYFAHTNTPPHLPVLATDSFGKPFDALSSDEKEKLNGFLNHLAIRNAIMWHKRWLQKYTKNHAIAVMIVSSCNAIEETVRYHFTWTPDAQLKNFAIALFVILESILLYYFSNKEGIITTIAVFNLFGVAIYLCLLGLWGEDEIPKWNPFWLYHEMIFRLLHASPKQIDYTTYNVYLRAKNTESLSAIAWISTSLQHVSPMRDFVYISDEQYAIYGAEWKIQNNTQEDDRYAYTFIIEFWWEKDASIEAYTTKASSKSTEKHYHPAWLIILTPLIIVGVLFIVFAFIKLQANPIVITPFLFVTPVGILIIAIVLINYWSQIQRWFQKITSSNHITPDTDSKTSTIQNTVDTKNMIVEKYVQEFLYSTQYQYEVFCTHNTIYLQYSLDRPQFEAALYDDITAYFEPYMHFYMRIQEVIRLAEQLQKKTYVS